MKKKDVVISVIVPIYEVEDYLSRCVCSILNQTYKEFELILVDDGSTDQCPQLCDEWAKKDSRIKVIHKKNGGLSDARNAGMQVASGEYIAFVDSDDWVSPLYLEYLMTTMKENGCDIVECEIIRTADSQIFEELSGTDTVSVERFQTEEALGRLICDHVFHQYVWNKLYKKAVIQKILFEKGKTNEDEFWTYQVFGNAKIIGKIETPLYYYFQRSSSIMGRGYSLKRLDALEAKIQRQRYIEENYPKLKHISMYNLFTTCIYQGQMCLLNLKGEQFSIAKERIDSVVKEIKPVIRIKGNLSSGEKIWIYLARFSFWGTCRIKNLLGRGF